MTKKFLTPLNVIIILIFIGINSYIYFGFYFPDPTIFYIHKYTNVFLIIIKLFYPAAIISLIVIYRILYLKKIHLGSVIILFLTCIFLLLLAYPIADYYYRNNSAVNTSDIHPYLQINPSDVQNMENDNYNIFCLGGSTTEFTDELGRDWPGLVQTELNKKITFEQIRLFNLGKQWYTTQHILINYEFNLKKYNPKVLLVMENINDLLHNADFSWLSSGNYRDDYGHFLGPMARLVKYKSFAEYFKNILKKAWYQKDYIDIETDSFPGLAAYERNLKSLINLSKENGTKVILMTQPNIYKDTMTTEELSKLTMLNVEALGNGKRWTYKTALNGFIKYNDKVRETAANDSEIFLIDLERIVPKSLEYFIDDVHYNSKAHDLIATYITAELEKFLKLEFSDK